MHADYLMLVALIGAHFYFDYAGQGDFMARAKNCTAPINGVPWAQVLTAHAAIHGAAAALITGIWWISLLEGVIHWNTDNLKCTGAISYRTDQFVHIACKYVWFWIAIYVQAHP